MTYRNTLNGLFPSWNILAVLGEIGKVVGKDAENEDRNQELQNADQSRDTSCHQSQARHVESSRFQDVGCSASGGDVNKCRSSLLMFMQ